MKKCYIILLLLIPFTINGEVYTKGIIDFTVNYPVKKNLPISRMEDNVTVSSLKAALEGVAWIKEGVVRDIIINEEWRIQRDEFTGINKSRYLKASVLFLKNSDREFLYVIPCTFVQNLEYLGFLKGDVRYKMSHRYEIYKIHL